MERWKRNTYGKRSKGRDDPTNPGKTTAKSYSTVPNDGWEEFRTMDVNDGETARNC